MELYFDGGCKPNPGMCEIGVVIPSIDLKHHELIGYGTNNQAEWAALIFGLTIAKEKGITILTVIGDSRNVIMQASGRWTMKTTSVLYDFWIEHNKIAQNFERIKYVHVLRDKNLAGRYLEKVNSK